MALWSNYGFFTWWMISRFPHLRAYPFEPNPVTFSKVEKIVLENHLTNVHPQNIGLGDCEESLALHPGVEDSGHSTFGNHQELAGKSISHVSVLPFDRWLENAGISLPPKPLWMAKIDVENFELKVLQGLQNALCAKVFLEICIEFNDFTLNFCGTSAAELEQFILECGYVPYQTNKKGNLKRMHRTANRFFVSS